MIEFGNQCVHRLYHQVYVDRSGGVGAQRGTDHGAESQVRYKVVVHDVAVNPVGAGGNYIADFFTQTGEVSR